MLINVKRVKQVIKEYNKQCSREFIERLDFIVRVRIEKAIVNSKKFKRLKASELI